MKTVEKLEAILCNPDGVVCIDGTDEDKKTLTEAVSEVRVLEKENEKLCKVQDCIQTIKNSEWDGNINHFKQNICDMLARILEVKDE